MWPSRSRLPAVRTFSGSVKGRSEAAVLPDWDITEAGILSAVGNSQVFPPGKASFPPQTSSFKSVDVNDLPKCLWGCGRFGGP